MKVLMFTKDYHSPSQCRFHRLIFETEQRFSFIEIRVPAILALVGLRMDQGWDESIPDNIFSIEGTHVIAAGKELTFGFDMNIESSGKTSRSTRPFHIQLVEIRPLENSKIGGFREQKPLYLTIITG